MNPNAVAKSVGLSRRAVLRIAADPDAAYARVGKWALQWYFSTIDAGLG